jgi:hypothetical protein
MNIFEEIIFLTIYLLFENYFFVHTILWDPGFHLYISSMSFILSHVRFEFIEFNLMKLLSLSSFVVARDNTIESFRDSTLGKFIIRGLIFLLDIRELHYPFQVVLFCDGFHFKPRRFEI